ncbi:MAG TPA: hypothetical protein PLM24_05605 [Methanothrix sp.]|nr:hypothetical protein [Methanothrix sp.]HPJ84014.1 hypothetical protein [Methanothrix sp.]HPR66596.1 hypothetical protein [Methanothrix sp.]
MRSIALLILAVMVLSTVADAGCCCGGTGGGGVDGVGGSKMKSNICPADYTIRGPQMTYEEDGRYGVTVVIDPIGKASLAFVGGEDGGKPAVPVQGGISTGSGDLPFGQEVIAHLNDVQMDFSALREMWEA